MIFKLLLIWHALKANSEEEQTKQRKKVKTTSIVYYIIWGVCWASGRWIAFRIIETEEQDTQVFKEQQALFFITTLIQTLMELGLFAYFLSVLFNFRKFLKSIKEGSISRREFKLILQTQTLINSFATIICVVMITDTVYAVMAPQAFVYSVKDPNSTWFNAFDVVVQVFFLMNTIFSCFVTYIMLFFHRLSAEKVRQKTIDVPRQETSNQTNEDFEDLEYNRMLLNFTDIDTPDGLKETKESQLRDSLRKSEVQIEEAMMEFYIGLRNQPNDMQHLTKSEENFEKKLADIKIANRLVEDETVKSKKTKQIKETKEIQIKR